MVMMMLNCFHLAGVIVLSPIFTYLFPYYTYSAMPVEITPFCHEHTQRTIVNLPSVKGFAEGKLRMDGGKPYITDNDNYIVDLYFKDPIKDSKKVAHEVSKMMLACSVFNRSPS